MSWVSERHLVAAISNAGGFGVIACGSMNPDQLAAEIAGTQALTSQPFGVNLITMHPQLDDLIRVCLDAKVGHIVLAGGIPPGARGARGQGRRREADRFTPALVLAKRLVRSRRRRAGDRGLGGRRPYRPGLADRAGAGNPAAYPRGAGLRRRRAGPRRGDPGLPGNGRLGRAARHPLRRGHRIHRPSELQAGVHPRQCPRRGALDATRRALPGDPGARPGQRGHQAVPAPPGGNPRPLPRRRTGQGSRAACRSSISGPARCAAR